MSGMTSPQPAKDGQTSNVALRRGQPSDIDSSPTATALVNLQRSIGNAATTALLRRGTLQLRPGLPVVQRFIQIGKEKTSCGSLANTWSDKNRTVPNGYARAMSAAKTIEASGEMFTDMDELLTRLSEVVEAQKDRAVKPITWEANASRVAIELDYHWADIDPKPKMNFVRTYRTSWDTTGGWGAEYAPVMEGPGNEKWVLHVHRGPNGGLKAARIKTWAERELPQKGATLSIVRATDMGIAQTDITVTH